MAKLAGLGSTDAGSYTLVWMQRTSLWYRKDHLPGLLRAGTFDILETIPAALLAERDQVAAKILDRGTA